jgi:hypothetical protein
MAATDTSIGVRLLGCPRSSLGAEHAIGLGKRKVREPGDEHARDLPGRVPRYFDQRRIDVDLGALAELGERRNDTRPKTRARGRVETRGSPSEQFP